MKTITLLSLISAAFIGLTQPTWAGPHGGGAGFDGGGGRAGPVGGGRGFHGGGFRGGAGPRFSSFGRPSDRQSVYSGRPSRTVTLSPFITVSRRLIPRSKLPRSGLHSWAITTVQSMAFSDRRRVTRWRIIKSPTS